MTGPLVELNVQVYIRMELFVKKGFLIVKETQNYLYYFIISFLKEKNTRKLLRKIDAPCKRNPLHGSLAFEWISFSRDV